MTDDASQITDEDLRDEEATLTDEPRKVRRWLRPSRPRSRVIVFTAVVVAAAALAASIYFIQYRSDRHTDAAAAGAAKKAAEDGTVALLSYSPDNLDGDIAKAKSYLTGDFLTYYSRFTEQIGAAAAQQRKVTSSAQVVRAGVAELHPDSAVVLVFINKESSSKDNPAPALTPATVQVTLAKVDDSWLIAKFDPL